MPVLATALVVAGHPSGEISSSPAASVEFPVLAGAHTVSQPHAAEVPTVGAVFVWKGVASHRRALQLVTTPCRCPCCRARLPSVQVAARVVTGSTKFSTEMYMRVAALGSRTVWTRQLVVLRDVYMVMYASISSQRPRMTIPLRDVVVLSMGGAKQDEVSTGCCV